MTTELTLFSDYFQIEIFDSRSESPPEDGWGRDDTPVRDNLALAEDAVCINTGVNDYVTISIDQTGGPPAEGKDAFDTVTECSLRANSGELVVTSPTWGLGRRRSGQRPPGMAPAAHLLDPVTVRRVRRGRPRPSTARPDPVLAGPTRRPCPDQGMGSRRGVAGLVPSLLRSTRY